MPTSNKRRRTSSPEPSARVPLQDVGRDIGRRWSDLTDSDRIKYDQLAAHDSERYEREIELYYYGAATSRNCEVASSYGGSIQDGLRGFKSSSLLLAAPLGGGGSGKEMVRLDGGTEMVARSESTKSTLQSLLSHRRAELLSDIGALNAIAASSSVPRRGSRGAVARQRLFNLNAGPKSSSTTTTSTRRFATARSTGSSQRLGNQAISFSSSC